MSSDEAMQQKLETTLQQTSEIINDAKARLGELERLLEQHDLPADFAQRILGSNVLSAEQKQRAVEEREQFEQELAQDLRAAEDLAKSQRRKVKTPRRGMRI